MAGAHPPFRKTLRLENTTQHNTTHPVPTLLDSVNHAEITGATDGERYPLVESVAADVQRRTRSMAIPLNPPHPGSYEGRAHPSTACPAPRPDARPPGSIRFITVLARERLPWIALNSIQRTLERAWHDAPGWRVGHYLLMPSVLHFFGAPEASHASPDVWMASWRSLFEQRAGSASWRWQADHWTSQLRPDDCYAERWNFLRAHPVREGLVTHPDDWPHQGVLHDLSDR